VTGRIDEKSAKSTGWNHRYEEYWYSNSAAFYKQASVAGFYHHADRVSILDRVDINTRQVYGTEPQGTPAQRPNKLGWQCGISQNMCGNNRADQVFVGRKCLIMRHHHQHLSPLLSLDNNSTIYAQSVPEQGEVIH
jgi:hypothetical protein